MPPTAAPSVKEPCAACRERHQKCDELRPRCSRCQAKDRECIRAQRKTVFRHWATKDNDGHSSKRQRLSQAQPELHTITLQVHAQRKSNDPEETSPVSGTSSLRQFVPTDQLSYVSPDLIIDSENVAESIGNRSVQSGYGSAITSPEVNTHHSISNHVVRSNNIHFQPLKDVQEACLLRFYTEEVAHWFDLCDPQRHFQLVVPRRAQHCAPLRNAIFAVASRHLVRLPRYRTPDGIVFHGEHLPHLTSCLAVEYMLKCIPALSEFHNARDREYQENVMAAAVILRQCEEMEEEESDNNSELLGDNGAPPLQHVNFLSITQAIIESTLSSPARSSLANAVFWTASRQEIYFCMRRERAPLISFGWEKRNEASIANKLVIFLVDVASWRWGDKSPQGWSELKDQQNHLTQECLSQCVPIFEREANKLNGEIFPQAWYGSDEEMTGVQFFEIARCILIAENPNLPNIPNYRAAQRKAEADVRSIVLKLCGIALSRPQCPPALLIGVVAILLYGDYFIDLREREALMGIIEKTENMRAWSMRKPLGIVMDRWNSIDSED